MVGLTRRALLARGAAAGLVVAGCGGGSDETPSPSAAQRDIRLLKRALELEFASRETYARLAPQPRPAERRLVRRLEAAEARHVTVVQAEIRRLGGGDPEVGTFSYSGLTLEEALQDEERVAEDYLRLLPRLRTPSTRTLIGFILAEEAAHASALRDALGREPVPGAFL